MYNNIDQIEKSYQANHPKKPSRGVFSFMKEIQTVFVIFFFVSIGFIVFTNIQLFVGDSTDINNPENKVNMAIYDNNTTNNDSSISSIIQHNSDKEAEIQSLIQEKKQTSTDLNYLGQSLESTLKSNSKNYDFTFNTLPPVDRVIVPALNIDVPLHLSQYKDVKDFTNGNFDEELKNGVVLYPTTPVPGNGGNTLIFGHTSQEFRKLKENPYGTVFVNLPKLNIGDEIKVVWKGKLYTYKAIDKVVKTPKQVNTEYLKYSDDNYVTLMGCYPIGTDKERIMVIGKLVE